MGISHLAFDREATLLLIRLDNQPNVAHIYSFLPTPTSEQLSVTHTVSAIFSREIKKAKWSPVKSKLSVVTKCGGVYFWNRESGWIEEESGGSFECYTEIDGNTGGMMEGVGIPTRKFNMAYPRRQANFSTPKERNFRHLIFIGHLTADL